ncbi:hypothetical protein [Phycicoccus sp. DTK01]|uniref:hypothetical protein n=1 Tax=Phycicoccus sp. DTK01 TaxID=2785745 RepID=UPI001A903E77|nr:hypothetical protein [Phycicoccus sp. DTK01]
MKAAGRRVLAVLQREAELYGRVVTLSTTELAILCGRSTRTVEYGLSQLRDDHVTITYDAGSGARLIHVPLPTQDLGSTRVG